MPANIQKIIASGLERVQPLGGGMASWVFYRIVTNSDGTETREISGEVICNFEAVPEAISMTMTAMVAAGLNNAVAKVRSKLGHVFH